MQHAINYGEQLSRPNGPVEESAVFIMNLGLRGGV